MSSDVDALRGVLDEVVGIAGERLSGASLSEASAFLERWFERIPVADLAGRDASAWFADAMEHRDFGEVRRPQEALVRVRTPDAGHLPGHTVVEVVTDDMPFLVDSVTMAVVQAGHGIHLVVHPMLPVQRDADGAVVGIHDGAPVESWIHLEIDRIGDRARRAALAEAVGTALEDVRAAVEDWAAMRDRAVSESGALAAGVDAAPDPDECREASELLSWMADDHFTFLGSRDYELRDGVLRAVAGSGLGLLRDDLRPSRERPLVEMAAGTATAVTERRLLVVTRARARSTVHRPDHLAYVGIKRFGADGSVEGERRFVGLWTALAYRASAMDVPFLERRIRAVLDRAGCPMESHDGRALWNILETYPRDELFQLPSDELFEVATGILALQERKQVKLFARHDPFGRFVSCLVFLPRDRYSASVQERVVELLVSAYGGDTYETDALLGDSVLARIHVVVYQRPGRRSAVDDDEVERRVVAVCRWWLDELRDALVEAHGEDTGLRLLALFREAFPASYRESTRPTVAVGDIAHLVRIGDSDGDALATTVARPPEAADDEARLRLCTTRTVTLSAVLPLLEHLGASVTDERPFQIRPRGLPATWVYDIGLRSPWAERLAEPAVRELWQDAFAQVWRGSLEDDSLNRLVLAAGLRAHQVSVLRAYLRYLRQVGIPYTSRFLEDTLVRHASFAAGLARLFELRFDPVFRPDVESARATDALAGDLHQELTSMLDEVERLDEDRVLRAFLALVMATVRTNAYRAAAGVEPTSPVLAFKLEPARVPDLPLPKPRHEIWVHSPRVEGVHLRGGDVARGGLRWSDRTEDFRTEVLGLMKAQMVKNAVIVPVGAKGGFVVRRPPEGGTIRDEVEACYRAFVGGLLDLTDNLVDGRVVPPAGVVRHDGDDPYLVVAADKGTATFSDLANSVAASYGFWLGDAFASGGSVGYDHKDMGITARGAWESVRRHFRTLGRDADREPVTVVGVGDMSGDVFGNGMLLSPQLRLVAAFDHRDVFLDPDPDPAVQLAERRRLYETPRSTWQSFDRALLSPGGGVFSRSLKSIPLSAEVRERLGVEADSLSPPELIQAILRAPVDLLWNGGIGTYVKASTERHADVGDRANDAVRVDGRDLRCLVVGEGGNLGLTQRGRVEAALHGVLLNSDAIDNSAGVDCSDHEVNIKILLDGAVAEGRLTTSERNDLLAAMTDDVAALVLADNVDQNVALAVARAQAAPMVDVHARYVRALEQEGLVDRELEYLPSETEFDQRQAAGLGLTTPEFAVLLAYTKTTNIAEVLASDLPDDPAVQRELVHYFPPLLVERYGDRLGHHRLRREIVANRLVNHMVNTAGTSFDHRMLEETGASVPDITRAHEASRRILDLDRQWEEVLGLDGVVPADTQMQLFIELRRMVERGVLWLLRHRRPPLDIAGTEAALAPGLAELTDGFASLVTGTKGTDLRVAAERYEWMKVPPDLAVRAAAWPLLHTGLDLVEVAAARGRSPRDATVAYWELFDRLDLGWVWERIGQLPRTDRWQAHARAAMRDDLLLELRRLTDASLRAGDIFTPPAEAVHRWLVANQRSVERLARVFSEIRAGGTFDLTTISVALRQLRNLASR